MALDLEAATATVATYVAAAGLVPTTDALEAAVAAELADQANRCRVPDPYPPALLEALCRRVAHNLAVRGLPLGVQQIVTDAAAASTYVGGYDAEARRLEGPYRRRVLG